MTPFLLLLPAVNQEALIPGSFIQFIVIINAFEKVTLNCLPKLDFNRNLDFTLINQDIDFIADMIPKKVGL